VENKLTKPLDPNAYKGNTGMMALQQWRDDLKKELEETKQALAKEQHLVREYQKRVNYEEADNERMKFKATKMVEFVESKELFLGEQATDDDIISRYKRLGHLVKNWSKPVTIDTDFSAFELEEEQLSKITTMILPSIVTKGQLQKLLEGKAQRRQVARAWVHLILYDEVLNIRQSPMEETRATTTDLWMGEPVASAVSTVENVLARGTRIQ
jgi:hypothetical protein